MIRRVNSLPTAFVAPRCKIACSGAVLETLRRCATTASSATALLALNDQISKLIVDFDVKADLNSRMITNADSRERPWEASCIEIQRKDEGKVKPCFAIPAAKCPSASKAEGKQTTTVDDSVIVLYYETHTPEGLAAYRSIATRVALGQLPGETVNRSAFGFAMWRVAAQDFLELNARPKLEQ